MIVSVSLFAWLATAQMFVPWMRAAQPWGEPAIQPNRVETPCIELSANQSLIQWLADKRLDPPNLTEPDMAQADGFIQAVIRDNRIDEFHEVLFTSSWDIQRVALSYIMAYLRRNPDQSSFDVIFQVQLTSLLINLSLQEGGLSLISPSLVSLPPPFKDLYVKELWERTNQCEDEAKLLDLLSSLSIAVFGWQRSEELMDIQTYFLNSISYPLLLDNPPLWDIKIRDNLVWWYRNQYSNPIFKALLRIVNMQVSLIRPALTDSPEEVTALLNAKHGMEKGQLLASGLNSPNHRLQLLAYDLAAEADNESFDELLKLHPGNIDNKGHLFDLFFDRKQLSPASVEIILNWTKSPRGKAFDRLISQLPRWGKSALPLFPSILSHTDLHFLNEEYESVATWSQQVSILEFLEANNWTELDRTHLIDAIAFSRKSPLDLKQLENLRTFVLTKTHKFTSKEDRRLLNCILNVFEQRFQEIPKDYDIKAFELVNFVFDLPPDKLTDEVLLRLTRELQNRSGEQFPRLQKMLDEMK